MTSNNKPVICALRFSIVLERDKDSWISSRDNLWEEHISKMMDLKRLRFRLFLLENIVIPQLLLQTVPVDKSWFRLLIFTSTLLPDIIIDQLNALALNHNWISIVKRAPSEWMSVDIATAIALDSIFQGNPKDKIPFCSMRLDDDDFLSIDFMEKIQSYISMENVNKFVTFPFGDKILWDEHTHAICNVEPVERPYIAIGLSAICEFDSLNNTIVSAVKTVFAGINHKKIGDKYNCIIDDSKGMYLWSHHFSQDTFNKFEDEFFLTIEPQEFKSRVVDLLNKFPSIENYCNLND